MTPIWPSNYGDQRNFIADVQALLTTTERRIRVPTVHKNTTPTEADLNAAWSLQAGVVGTVPDGGKVQWFRPDRNALMSAFTRIGDAGIPIDGQLAEMVARVTNPYASSIYEDLLLAAAANISVAIPQTHFDALVHLRLRGTVAAAEATMNLIFNGDAAANYYSSTLRITNTGAAGVEAIAANNFALTVQGASSGRNQYTDILLFIPWYTRPGRRHSVWMLYGEFRGSTIAATDMFWRTIHGDYHVIGALTNLTITPASGNVEKGSLINIIGIRN